MIKKLQWIFPVIIVFGYIITTCVDNNAKEKAEEEKKQKDISEKSSRIASMAQSWNADDSWVSQLSNGEKIKIGNIMVIDLEKVWLQNKPILFYGFISDISTYNEDFYVITMKRGYGGKIIIAQELRLLVIAEKAKIDHLRMSHPEITESFGRSNIAAIVSISSINSQTTVDSDGDEKEIKIGNGRMIDLVYIGETRIEYN